MIIIGAKTALRKLKEMQVHCQLLTMTCISLHLHRVVFKWLWEKKIPKWLLQPITTGANSAVNQSEFLEILGTLLKV